MSGSITSLIQYSLYHALFINPPSERPPGVDFTLQHIREQWQGVVTMIVSSTQGMRSMLMVIFHAPLSVVMVNTVALRHSQTATLLAFCFYCSKQQ